MNAEKKTPQEIKSEKLLASIEEITGISFGGPLGQEFAEAINDAVLTGARQINPDEQDAVIHCNAEWHFARFTGTGKNLVPSLYGISFHLAKESGSFFVSGVKLGAFLDTKEDNIYAAAHLLRASGFWQVVKAEIGKPVEYRPVGHDEWQRTHTGRCTKKLDNTFTQDDEELAKFGRDLYAIFGGQHFVPGVVKGFRNAAHGRTDAEICHQAKAFREIDKANGGGKEQRKRFLAYLQELGPAPY